MIFTLPMFDLILDRRHVQEHALGACQDALPGLGGQHLRPRTYQQGLAHLHLKAADPLAQSRLGTPEPARGQREAAFVENLLQRFELSSVH